MRNTTIYIDPVVDIILPQTRLNIFIEELEQTRQTRQTRTRTVPIRPDHTTDHTTSRITTPNPFLTLDHTIAPLLFIGHCVL